MGRPGLRLAAIDGLPAAGKPTLARRPVAATGGACLKPDELVRPEAPWRVRTSWSPGGARGRSVRGPPRPLVRAHTGRAACLRTARGAGLAARPPALAGAERGLAVYETMRGIRLDPPEASPCGRTLAQDLDWLRPILDPLGWAAA